MKKSEDSLEKMGTIIGAALIIILFAIVVVASIKLLTWMVGI